MSYINLLGNDVWTESDIVSRGRAVINSQVSEARQNELRTIMLGHIAQMRTATPQELQEIMLVQSITETQVLENEAARKDNDLLAAVILYETLAKTGVELPTDTPFEVTELFNLRNPDFNSNLIKDNTNLIVEKKEENSL